MILMEKVTHRSLNPVFISERALLSLKKSSCCWIKTSIRRSPVRKANGVRQRGRDGRGVFLGRIRAEAGNIWSWVSWLP